MHLNEGLEKIEKMQLNKELRPIERDLIWQKMGNWPNENLMPVIDLWRLHLLHPSSTHVFKGTDRGYSHIMRMCKLIKDDASGALAVGAARVLANIFKMSTNASSMMDRKKEVFTAISEVCDKNDVTKIHKLAKVALSTCLLNYSCQFNTVKMQDGKAEFVACVQSFLSKVTDEKESIYRAVVALGNLLLGCGGDPSASSIKPLLEKVKSTHLAEVKIKESIDECLKIIG